MRKARAPLRPFWPLLRRALGLRCPTCGESPLFLPWNRLRRLDDWFQPLDGCPRCGYAYEREPGYFLLAIWALNYSSTCIFGLVLFGILDRNFDLDVGQLLIATLLPMVIWSLLTIRRSKAIWLAIDRWLDPSL